MSPREVLADVRRQPFEPFIIRMTDGAAFEIRHPDQCLVLKTAAIVGVKSDPEEELADQYVKIDLHHISRIQYLAASQAPGSNGQPSE